MRRRPDGDEVVVAKNVVAFDVDPAGNVYVSDGCGVDRIAPDGTTTKRVARAQRVMAIATMG